LLNTIESTITEYVDKFDKKVVAIANKNSQESLQKIVKIKNKINKLTALYLDGAIDIDYYKQQYLTLNSTLKLKEETHKEKKTTDLSKIEMLLNKSWQELYDTLENKEKRELWRVLIEQVIFENKEKWEVILKLY